MTVTDSISIESGTITVLGNNSTIVANAFVSNRLDYYLLVPKLTNHIRWTSCYCDVTKILDKSCAYQSFTTKY